jgi:sulfur-oxidizing protein SoxB
VAEEAKAAGGEPIWDLVERYLLREKTIRARPLNLPEVVGMRGNPGMG